MNGPISPVFGREMSFRQLVSLLAKKTPVGLFILTMLHPYLPLILITPLNSCEKVGFWAIVKGDMRYFLLSCFNLIAPPEDTRCYTVRTEVPIEQLQLQFEVWYPDTETASVKDVLCWWQNCKKKTVKIKWMVHLLNRKYLFLFICLNHVFLCPIQWISINLVFVFLQQISQNIFYFRKSCFFYGALKGISIRLAGLFIFMNSLYLFLQINNIRITV